MRVSIYKQISNPAAFKKQLLLWSQQFREVIFMDSNDYPQGYSSYDCLLAVDAFTSIKTDYHNAFEDLKQYQQITKDWLFGYLSYDLKNDVESRAALVHKISFCALPNVSSKDKNILLRSHAQRLIYCIDLLIRASKIN